MSKVYQFRITVKTEENGRPRADVLELLEGEIQGTAIYVEDDDGEESIYTITEVV